MTERFHLVLESGLTATFDAHVLDVPGSPVTLEFDPKTLKLGLDYVQDDDSGLFAPPPVPPTIDYMWGPHWMVDALGFGIITIDEALQLSPAPSLGVVDDDYYVVAELCAIVPGLKDATATCPLPVECGTSEASVVNLVVHLNDFHRWTREAIADWLDTLDIDLTVRPREENEDDHRSLACAPGCPWCEGGEPVGVTGVFTRVNVGGAA